MYGAWDPARALSVEGGQVARIPGGVIASVVQDSLGEAAGLWPGDRLLAINGHPLRDIIDVQFYGAEEILDLLVERNGQQLIIHVQRDYNDELGISFENPTFDVDIRRCNNNCDFCFVKQNARGMRRSLYVKDDDYRYSFLFGNFVTLGNLRKEDWTRLEEQRLSPLYVSVHTSDLELRRRFLGRKTAPDVMGQLERLAGLDIEVHTQIVLVPGLNDGKHLAKTVRDLTNLCDRPVASIGIVPIGLTRYHSGQCRTYTQDESQAVLEQVGFWQAENRKELDRTFVHASDEWYLVAGQQIPPADMYDGFPQVENGVGMVRQLLDEASAHMVHSRSTRLLRPATLCCGTLIAPVWGQIVEVLNSLAGARVQLVPVTNRFFGPVTTVSGLLTGQDILATLRDQALSDLVLLPRAMFTGQYGAGAAPPGTTLDDMHIKEVQRQLNIAGAGVQVEMAGTLTEVLSMLRQDFTR
jgi:putative radical SAM enzyme (TIGR03279 family)